MGDLLDFPVPEVFDIDVILLNICDPGRVRIEFGIHQAGLGCISAQLLELAALTVKKPIVSARICAPYAACIRKDQDALVVFRPAEPSNLQGFLCAFRRELRRRDQGLAVLACGGVVLYDITPMTAGYWLHRNVGLPVFEPARWRRGTLTELISEDASNRVLWRFRRWRRCRLLRERDR